MKKLDKLTIQKDQVKKVAKKAERNKEIAGYYLELGERRRDEKLVKKYYDLLSCFKTFEIDFYKKQKIKDVKKVYRCHDVFCVNCQSQLASERYATYVPYLDALREFFDIYHVTFTVPNPFGPKLQETVDCMYKKFPYVIQYFQSKRKLKNFDFSVYGFVGAIRALEITSNMTNNGIEYHPHFHTFFLFDKKSRKYIRTDKIHINDYSFKKNTSEVRYFTNFEIFLQKMWRLLFEGEKLSLKAINALDIGYSGVVDVCKPGKYKEVFKYALKGTFKNDVFAYDADSFRYLHDTLKKRKLIQGYGIFRGFKFDVDDGEADRISAYNEIVKTLLANETPSSEYSSLTNILSDMNQGIKYISKRRIGSSAKKGKIK